MDFNMRICALALLCVCPVWSDSGSFSIGSDDNLLPPEAGDLPNLEAAMEDAAAADSAPIEPSLSSNLYTAFSELNQQIKDQKTSIITNPFISSKNPLLDQEPLRKSTPKKQKAMNPELSPLEAVPEDLPGKTDKFDLSTIVPTPTARVLIGQHEEVLPRQKRCFTCAMGGSMGGNNAGALVNGFVVPNDMPVNDVQPGVRMIISGASGNSFGGSSGSGSDAAVFARLAQQMGGSSGSSFSGSSGSDSATFARLAQQMGGSSGSIGSSRFQSSGQRLLDLFQGQDSGMSSAGNNVDFSSFSSRGSVVQQVVPVQDQYVQSNNYQQRVIVQQPDAQIIQPAPVQNQYVQPQYQQQNYQQQQYQQQDNVNKLYIQQRNQNGADNGYMVFSTGTYTLAGGMSSEVRNDGYTYTMSTYTRIINAVPTIGVITLVPMQTYYAGKLLQPGQNAFGVPNVGTYTLNGATSVFQSNGYPFTVSSFTAIVNGQATYGAVTLAGLQTYFNNRLLRPDENPYGVPNVGTYTLDGQMSTFLISGYPATVSTYTKIVNGVATYGTITLGSMQTYYNNKLLLPGQNAYGVPNSGSYTLDGAMTSFADANGYPVTISSYTKVINGRATFGAVTKGMQMTYYNGNVLPYGQNAFGVPNEGLYTIPGAINYVNAGGEQQTLSTFTRILNGNPTYATLTIMQMRTIFVPNNPSVQTLFVQPDSYQQVGVTRYMFPGSKVAGGCGGK